MGHSPGVLVSGRLATWAFGLCSTRNSGLQTDATDAKEQTRDNDEGPTQTDADPDAEPTDADATDADATNAHSLTR